MHIAVIADDLTGAADTGVQFARSGHRAVVVLDPDLVDSTDAEVVIGVTDTRLDSPADAAARTALWARRFALRRPARVYKKMDSTLRGSLGAELDACMAAFPGWPALVAPAFPANGRVTAGGWQLLHGRPLEVTAAGRDLTNPVRNSHLPTLLAAQTGRRIAHLPLGPVALGGPALAKLIRAHLDGGAEVLVADATADADLANLAAALGTLDTPVLWSGSAGLARHLLPRRRSTNGVPAPVAALPFLLVVGSLSPTARRTVDHYLAECGADCVTADPALLAGEPAAAMAEVDRVAAAVRGSLAQGRDTVLVSGAGLPPSTPPALTGRAVAAGLAHAVHAGLGRGFAGTMLLSGGDTALAVCRRLGATGIRLAAELTPGVPLGYLVGGAYAGLQVVTKAGSFGRVNSLCQIRRMLQEGRPR